METDKETPMATDRLYLAHVPSRKAVYLGKRFGPDSGWYGTPGDLAERVDRLFEAAFASPDWRTGFRVVYEDNDEGIGIGPPDENGLRPVFLPEEILLEPTTPNSTDLSDLNKETR